MSKYSSTIVFMLLLLLQLPWLGLRDFYSRGEPREALVAQSMLEQGDWILGQGYGESVPSKPPFTHWLTAFFSLPLGEVTEFTARLPSALASSLFALCFFIFLRRRFSDTQAALSLLVLVTSSEWFRAGSTCRVDMTLAALLSGAMLLLFSQSEKPALSKALLASVLITLAGLTKGPVAFVLPLSIFFLFELSLKREFFRSALACCALTLIPILALGAWYWLAYQRGGEAFFYKIYQENVARFTGSMDEDGHRHGMFYLVGMLALGVAPWSLMLLPVWLQKLGKGVPGLRSLWERWKNTDTFSRFSWLATLIIFVFYCIPSSKRGVYLLPLYPFVSHLIALQLISLTRQETKLAQGVLVGFSALLSALFALSIGLSTGILRLEQFGNLANSTGAQFFLNGLAQLPGQFSSFSILIAFVVLLLSLILLCAAGRITHWAWYAAFLYGLYLLLNTAVLPYFANQLSAKSYSAQLIGKIPPSARVYSYNYEFYAVSFYSRRNILRWSSDAKAGDYVLLFQNDLQDLKSKLPPQLELQTILNSNPNLEKPGYSAVLALIE